MLTPITTYYDHGTRQVELAMAFATARAEEPDVELAVSGHWDAPTTSLALAHWPRFTIVTIFRVHHVVMFIIKLEKP